MPDLSGIPASLRGRSRWLRLGGVPAMVCHPDWNAADKRAEGAALPARPWLLWMHGRSVQKEIDPGRFQRLVRLGIASVAVDLPGHGERFEAALQDPRASLAVIAQMVEEIDGVLEGARTLGGLDSRRIALGGMSAGGMAALARLCRPHPFQAGVVECTTGSWRWQPNLTGGDPALTAALDPMRHLDDWRSIPLLALHNRGDTWVPIDGQIEFLSAVRARSDAASPIELHVYEDTGAPNEHAGFGRMGADAKDRVAQFLSRTLLSA